MHLVILAGGRGSRLGALTQCANKGALPFHGTPLITRTIRSFGRHREISAITVVTGYQAQSIERLVEIERIVTPVPISVISESAAAIGSAARACAAFRHLETSCLLVGIDVVLHPDTVTRLVDTARAYPLDPALAGATDITPTDSHKLFEVKGGVVTRFVTQGEIREPLRDMWLRYVPYSHFDQIEEYTERHNKPNLRAYLQHLVEQGVTVRGVRAPEPWAHVAYTRDFNQPDPVNVREQVLQKRASA